MVTVGELYALAVAVMGLVALAAALLVLRDIAREGRERLRARPEPPREDETAADGDDTVRCRRCGTVNDDSYVYCEGCSRQL